jgi:hypothetical protein
MLALEFWPHCGRRSGGAEKALPGLLILAGLRKRAEVIEREAGQMPILDDIMVRAVLCREFRRGLERGLHDGELTLLLRQIEKRSDCAERTAGGDVRGRDRGGRSAAAARFT